MKPWWKQSTFHRLFAFELECCPNAWSTVQPQNPMAGERPDDRIAHCENLLNKGIDSLNMLASCFQNDQNLAAMIRRLRDVVRLAHERPTNEIPPKENSFA